jgi:hypothetical protein
MVQNCSNMQKCWLCKSDYTEWVERLQASLKHHIVLQNNDQYYVVYAYMKWFAI